MKRRRVAIIGAGFSGVAVAACVARRGRNAPEAVLIERNGRFGRGLAYATQDATHVLDARAGAMSAYADRPDDFARWLQARGAGDAATFAVRGQFGLYVDHVLKRAQRGRLFGRAVRKVRGEAVACRAGPDRWTVSLADGGEVEADAVVLALGNPPPRAPAVLADAGVQLIDPWDLKALERLPRGDVLLLGAGLTMIDVALTLAARRDKGTIFALSRRGLTPRAHLTYHGAPKDEPMRLPDRLSDALAEFRRLAQNMAERGEPWQVAVDRLRRDAPQLWRRLPPEAQQRFLRHLRPWWEVHRHRAAPDVAARIAGLRDSGRLRVLAGKVTSAERIERGVQIQHRQRGSHGRHRLELAGVVNCTGADLDLRRVDSPLVNQVLAEGVARPGPNGLGFDVDDAGRVIGEAGVARPGLFAIGPITRGAFWESTAVPEIRARAAELAQLL